ncbi:hypothetical protein EDC04DRAFT_2803392, partial [Pisolithus marmoratus]
TPAAPCSRSCWPLQDFAIYSRKRCKTSSTKYTHHLCIFSVLALPSCRAVHRLCATAMVTVLLSDQDNLVSACNSRSRVPSRRASSLKIQAATSPILESAPKSPILPHIDTGPSIKKLLLPDERSLSDMRLPPIEPVDVRFLFTIVFLCSLPFAANHRHALAAR